MRKALSVTLARATSPLAGGFFTVNLMTLGDFERFWLCLINLSETRNRVAFLINAVESCKWQESEGTNQSNKE